MQLFTLNRFYLTDRTIGNLITPRGDFMAHTLELPWRGNRVNVSCIPEGTYLVKRDTTGKHQYYRFDHVEGRTDIEMHPATYLSHLQGCIGIGELTKDFNLLHSDKYLQLLMDGTDNQDFILQIKQ